MIPFTDMVSVEQAWIINVRHCIVFDAIIHSCPNGVEVKAWIIDYIPIIYMNAITNPCLDMMLLFVPS